MNKSNIIKNLSVDCVIFGFEKSQLKVLLIKLNVDPCKGQWALPGGNVRFEEDLEHAAQRVLEELTGVRHLYMEQLETFGSVNRFPLFRVITVAFYALVNPEHYKLTPGPKATEAKWFSISEINSLPFDHSDILKYAVRRLQNKVRYEPVGFELLPKKFKLSQLQELYESILDMKLDKRNFRKKLLSMNLLVQLDEQEKDVAHRAARLFKFDKRIYNSLQEKGFNFEL